LGKGRREERRGRIDPAVVVEDKGVGP